MAPAAVVVALVIATSGGGNAHGRTAVLPRLVSSYQDPSVGIGLRLPSDWTAANDRGVLRLSSHDSSAIIALAAFPDPAQMITRLAGALRTLLGEYPDTTVKSAPGDKLAGLPARSAVVSGRNRHGTTIRVLVAGAQGRTHAYLLDVFTGRNTPVRELVEAQEIIISLRLTG